MERNTPSTIDTLKKGLVPLTALVGATAFTLSGCSNEESPEPRVCTFPVEQGDTLWNLVDNGSPADTQKNVRLVQRETGLNYANNVAAGTNATAPESVCEILDEKGTEITWVEEEPIPTTLPRLED